MIETNELIGNLVFTGAIGSSIGKTLLETFMLTDQVMTSEGQVISKPYLAMNNQNTQGGVSNSGNSNSNENKSQDKLRRENFSEWRKKYPLKYREAADRTKSWYRKLSEDQRKEFLAKKKARAEEIKRFNQSLIDYPYNSELNSKYSDQQKDDLLKDVQESTKKIVEDSERVINSSESNFFGVRLFERTEENVIILALCEKNNSNRFAMRKGDFELRISEEYTERAEATKDGSLLVKSGVSAKGGNIYDSYLINKTNKNNIMSALDSTGKKNSNDNINNNNDNNLKRKINKDIENTSMAKKKK